MVYKDKNTLKICLQIKQRSDCTHRASNKYIVFITVAVFLGNCGKLGETYSADVCRKWPKETENEFGKAISGQ